MPIFDVMCKECGKETKDIWLKVDESPAKCDCGGNTFKICNCHSYKLIYNPKIDSCAWGDQNYQTTQRYKHVSKRDAEAQGID